LRQQSSKRILIGEYFISAQLETLGEEILAESGKKEKEKRREWEW